MGCQPIQLLLGSVGCHWEKHLTGTDLQIDCPFKPFSLIHMLSVSAQLYLFPNFFLPKGGRKTGSFYPVFSTGPAEKRDSGDALDLRW